jgi:hypothetical protein
MTESTHAEESLQALARRLGREGWYARITPTPGVHVVNPEAPALEDQVLARPYADGWWFCFGWGDPICPVDDLATAVIRIGHVLGLRSG